MSYWNNPSCLWCKKEIPWTKLPWYTDKFCDKDCHHHYDMVIGYQQRLEKAEREKREQEKFELWNKQRYERALQEQEELKKLKKKRKKKVFKPDKCKVCAQEFIDQFINVHNLQGFCHVRCLNIWNDKEKERRRLENRQIREFAKEREVENLIKEGKGRKCVFCDSDLKHTKKMKYCGDDCIQGHKIAKNNERWTQGLTKKGRKQPVNRNQQIEYARVKIHKNPINLKKWNACRG